MVLLLCKVWHLLQSGTRLQKWGEMVVGASFQKWGEMFLGRVVRTPFIAWIDCNQASKEGNEIKGSHGWTLDSWFQRVLNQFQRSENKTSMWYTDIFAGPGTLAIGILNTGCNTKCLATKPTYLMTRLLWEFLIKIKIYQKSESSIFTNLVNHLSGWGFSQQARQV